MTARRYSLATAIGLAARLADRASWYSRGALQRGRAAGRRALASWGVKIGQEYLELQCAKGNEASGLFSEFCAVIGCLDHFETHRAIYSGVRVDFGEHGLYYEPARGPNWWEYYFEPIAIGQRAQSRRIAPLWQHDWFAERVEQQLSRLSASALIGRYVRVRQPIIDIAEAFWRSEAGNDPVVGVHYRGTDKIEEAPRVPYDVVAASVTSAAPAGSWKVFVATDDARCLEYFQSVFPGRVISRQVHRSFDDRPVHKQPGDGYRKGLDALIDCLLLSRCSALFRTASNLGLVATYFNPRMPVRLIGEG
jgi:hypothetical protein